MKIDSYLKIKYNHLPPLVDQGSRNPPGVLPKRRPLRRHKANLNTVTGSLRAAAIWGEQFSHILAGGPVSAAATLKQSDPAGGPHGAAAAPKRPDQRHPGWQIPARAATPK